MEPIDLRYTHSHDKTNLAYAVLGNGPIDLIWNQGFVSNIELLQDLFPKAASFIDRLTSFARVIVWDRRGFGASDRPTSLPTLDEQLDDLRAVLDAAGSTRAALLGVSEGGPMSILFAATYPDRVSHLILCGSFPKLSRGDGYDHGLTPSQMRSMGNTLIERWGTGAIVDVFMPSLAGDEDIRRRFARFERLSTTPAGVRATLRVGEQIDVRHVLPTVHTPTLVMTRESDPITPVGHAHYMAEQMPNATLATLPGSDHILTIGDTEPILGAIEEFLTGHRALPQPDRVLSTVFFTDIVGSTERAASLGDAAWRRILEQHQQMIRRRLTEYRGREIKTTGDGFLAMFDGPTRAIRCAIDAVRDVRALGIEIRAGLHTGECEVMGEDIGGIAVHIASRVAGIASPSEVLVSRTVRDLSAGSSVTFNDRGAHTLKGVPDEWQVYSVEGTA